VAFGTMVPLMKNTHLQSFVREQTENNPAHILITNRVSWWSA